MYKKRITKFNIFEKQTPFNLDEIKLNDNEIYQAALERSNKRIEEATIIIKGKSHYVENKQNDDDINTIPPPTPLTRTRSIHNKRINPINQL